MKGVIEISMSMVAGIIAVALIFAIIINLALSEKTGLSGMLNFACDLCHGLIGNFLNVIGFDWINPCVNIINCCDENTGANCNNASGALGGYGSAISPSNSA